MNTAEILDRAADRIISHGWYQQGDGTHKDPDGTCAVLSIDFVAREGHQDGIPAMRTLARTLGLILPTPEGFSPLYKWNDSPTQTKENVILALRLAALHARMEETEKIIGQSLPELVEVLK